MKKLIFTITIFLIGFIGCEDTIDPPPPPPPPPPGLDCPEVEMKPLLGHVVQLPSSFIKCGEKPYPKIFEDVSGYLTDFGDVMEGGFTEFINCIPGVYNGTPVFDADYIGKFVDSNKDTVFYKGTFTFDPTTQGEGIRKSPSEITGGTGRWKEAKGCFRFYDITQLDDGTLQASVQGQITPPGVK